MTKRETEIFRYLMQQYKHQWDLNNYNRENYNEDLEYYLGSRDPSKYPLAYNHVFNRILPIIYTILSRFMGQMYQTSDIVSVKPRKKKDIFNAKSVEAVLNFQLENLNSIDMQGGSYLTMMKWFFNALTFGKGIVKPYWKKEERISPRRMALPLPNFDRLGNFQGMDVIDHISQEMQTIYDGPYVEVLHNKTFVPHPQYRSIQRMPAVFLVYKKSIDEIKKMANKGIYKNINKMGWESSGQSGKYAKDSDEEFMHSLGIEGALEIANVENDRKTKDVDIIEVYAKLIFDDSSYTVGSGLKIKGLEEEAIVHIGNYKTILKIQKNTYGIRPMFDIGAYMHPEMYWDVGLVRLTKGIQDQVNTLGNVRMQNVMMLVNQMLMVDANADIDPEALIWKPFGLIPVENVDSDIKPLTIPDMNSNMFIEQENFYEHTIQDLTGMYPYNMGHEPQRQERVGVVQSLQQMGEARAKLMLMSMDYLGIRPLLKYLMVLNTFHLPSGYEYRITDKENQSFGQIFGGDIHPDFDYAARYTASEPVLGKQYRLQQLLQLAALWKDNPWINQYQWNKTLLELGDVQEADFLLKQPQQFAQEMRQQQQAAMMAEQAKEKFETEGKLTIGQQGFGHDYALAEQEFGHDMALEAIKQEASSEKSS